MDSTRFWNLIAQIGWEKGATPQQGKAILLRLASRDEAYDFRCTLERFADRLMSTILCHTGRTLDLAYERRRDFLNHVVGCGRDTYEAEIAAPSLAVERMQSRNFRKAFSDCVPFVSDYSKPQTGAVRTGC